jgi:hypothetical protein
VSAGDEFGGDHDVVTARAAQSTRIPGIEDFNFRTSQENHPGFRNVRLQHARLTVLFDSAAQSQPFGQLAA